MTIRTEKRRVVVPGYPSVLYVTEDGEEFNTVIEAYEHEQAVASQAHTTPVVPEQFWTVQAAINKAVAEGRVIRFITDKPNSELKKGIEDIKGCKLMKPDKESNQIAVIPPGIEDYVF